MSSRVIVLGAGPTGSMLAALLAADGHDVHVFDKRPDPRDEDTQSGRSLNLTMAERGLRALDELGARDAVLERAVPLYGRVIHAADGSSEFVPYDPNGRAIYAIRRHDLTSLTVEAAERNGAKLHFRAACDDVDLEQPALRVREAGASTRWSADVLFAADGAYSTVRERMQRLRYFNYSQRYAHLEYVELVIPSDRDSSWGAHRDAVHLWPRGQHMLIGFPNLDGSLTVSLQMPREGSVSHEQLEEIEDVEGLFQLQFPDVLKDLGPLLEEYFERPTGTMVTIRCSPWSLKGRVILMGDAAHAIFPSYGQGCNASFEDCVALRDLARQSPDEWKVIAQEYEALRRPEADAIADLSIDHFDVLNRAVADPDEQLQAAVEMELYRHDPKFEPLYNLVSFTGTPYTNAVARDKSHRQIVRMLITQMRRDGLSAKEAVERYFAVPNNESHLASTGDMR